MNIVIYIIPVIVLVILGIVARSEKLPEQVENSGISAFINRISAFFYRKVIRRKRSLEVSSIKLNLNTMEPSNKGEEQAEVFYIKKISLCIMLIFVASFLAMVVWYQSRNDARLEKENSLKRESYGGYTTSTTLEARKENGELIGEYDISVDAKEYTEEEIYDMYTEMLDIIPENILADNESFDSISTNMNFPKSIEGYPFSISWNSSDYVVINNDGEISEDNVPADGADIVITATFRLQNFKETNEYTIKVVPRVLSDEEIKNKKMNELIDEEDNLSQTSDYQELPGSFDDENIYWQRPIEDSSIVIFILLIIVGIALYFLADEKLKEQIVSREEEMIKEYPSLISKIVLYLGAGLTVRGIFVKLSDDYKKQKEKDGKTRYTYEEIIILVNNLNRGASEEAAIEMFGARCRCQPYTRLVNLLVQNLKKGNSNLLTLLRQESMKASEQRISIARKAGEKVNTKLLAPMMLILLVIMIVIMIPAFSSF